jgi:hydroxymethylbilane synthase
MRKLIIGTRGSKLSLTQTEEVLRRFKEVAKGYDFQIRIIKTKGDKLINSPLSRIGGKGIFIKELEEELKRGNIDIAIHSMKDIPTQIPREFEIISVLKRLNPQDVLISKNKRNIWELPKNALVGTSSLRRKAQLLSFRDDLQILEIRGNLDTRIKKLFKDGLEAIVVAGCGLTRLEKEDLISQRLPLERFLPAAGQGALGVEIRDNDEELKGLIKKISLEDVNREVFAERAFLRRLGGGCQIPIGVLGKVEGKDLILRGMIISLDGKRMINGDIKGDKKKAEELGEKLAEMLLEKGAGGILERKE